MKKLLIISLILISFSCSEVEEEKSCTPLRFGSIVEVTDGFYRGHKAYVLSELAGTHCIYNQYLVVMYVDGMEIKTWIDILKLKVFKD